MTTNNEMVKLYKLDILLMDNYHFGENTTNG